MPESGPESVPTPPPLDAGTAWLCVLASGSAGNCSVFVRREAGRALPSVTLLDAGLSPRRTRRLLGERGIEFHQIDDIILTHLDSDHFHRGWIAALSKSVGSLRPVLRAHLRHAGTIRRRSPTVRRIEAFEDSFDTDGARAEVRLLSHDEEGVAAFRFELGDGRSLGYATDLGRATPELAQTMARVGTFAVESNYCPRMQTASSRPAHLKQRIMGGRGHLSNEQCAELVSRAAPAEHVVLLHLSRECNTPEIAASHHRGAAYALTISSQFEPTGWIPVSLGRVRDVVVCETMSLFGSAAGA